MAKQSWTLRRQISRAVLNMDVRIGERALPSGKALRGLYATRDFKVGDFVACYHGRVLFRRDMPALVQTDRALFDRICEYAVESGDHQFFNDDGENVGAHLINHSCGPNARWGHEERGGLLVQAVKPIAMGDEITIHYQWLGIKAAVEKSWHPCACRAPFCAGTIELKLEWIEHGDGTAGSWLSPEEMVRRLVVDLMNDTDRNEGLLHRYASQDVTEMVVGAQRLGKFDRGAYAARLVVASRAAASFVRGVGGYSERRLRQMESFYERGELRHG